MPMQKTYFSKLFMLQPGQIKNDLFFYAQRRWIRFSQKRIDRNQPTYEDRQSIPHIQIACLMPPLPIESLRPYAEQIASTAENFLEHRFDLLGSGWIRVKHGMQCPGLENFRYHMNELIETDGQGDWLFGRINRANLNLSRDIWSLVDADYVPIDWQIDFKSGYRWCENTWYRDIEFGPMGADIKLPLELSRMQHLPQLAWAYGLSAAGVHGFRDPEIYAREFRNQVLDFIATNPPRFGVNWFYAMDVAFRMASWLVTYDLINAFGASFDRSFIQIFHRSIFEHSRHIINNLEWNIYRRANHYLANIVGLIFGGAYLSGIPEADTWLAFGIRELINETKSQFHDDGGNAEASTAYHRLATEMVTYGTALILSLTKTRPSLFQALKNCDYRHMTKIRSAQAAPISYGNNLDLAPFPHWYLDKLERMAEFVVHITRPDGKITQIGDCDNGRFLKLHPVYQRRTTEEAIRLYRNLTGYKQPARKFIYWDENHLDHRHIVAAVNAFFDRTDFDDFLQGDSRETDTVKAMLQGTTVPSFRYGAKKSASAESIKIKVNEDYYELVDRIRSVKSNSEQKITIRHPLGNLLEELRLFGYPDFGIFIYHSPSLYLAIRCGRIDYNLRNGHAHNDQLSMELLMDNKIVFCDPGTYLYTPHPHQRNRYRSVKAHFCPQIDNVEPSNLKRDLFYLDTKIQADCLYFGKSGFVGRYDGYRQPVYRIVEILDSKINVIDIASGNQQLKNIYDSVLDHPAPIPVSPGYGLHYA